MSTNFTTYHKEITGERVNNIVLRSNDFRNLLYINCEFRGCDFIGSDWSGCKFINCYFARCDLRRCNFSGCELVDSYFQGCFFHGANLAGITTNGGCEFQKSSFGDVDFSVVPLGFYTNAFSGAYFSVPFDGGLPVAFTEKICPMCGKYAGTTMIRFNDGTVCCNTCASDIGELCDCCYTWHKQQELSVVGQYDLCDECLETHSVCDRCGRLVEKSCLYYDDYSGETLCMSCADDDVHTECILEYHDDWEKNFKGSDDGLYLGFECEVGDLTSNREKVSIAEEIYAPNEFVLMEDASITDYGFEIISHPWTLDTHEKYGWRVLNTLANAGMRSGGTSCCGLHIHASRSVLDEDTWARLALFIYRNQNFWETFARRASNHYASFDSLPIDTEEAKEYIKSSSIRYRAVNFCNKNTVEFRFFNGTIKCSTLFATLEVVHALVRFFGVWCKDSEPEITDFMNYILALKDTRYKHISPYLEKRGLLVA